MYLSQENIIQKSYRIVFPTFSVLFCILIQYTHDLFCFLNIIRCVLVDTSDEDLHAGSGRAKETIVVAHSRRLKRNRKPNKDYYYY
jgi:hypothetical protein